MPTQQEFTDAVLKAQLVTANSGNELILCEMSGCEADWSKAVCQFRQIQGALTCLSIGDYVSETALYFYNLMLDIVGLNYLDGVTPDPNAQLPAGITINIQDGAIDFDYDETDLIDGDPPNGNWYLPLKNPTTGNNLPSNYKPVLLTVNGASSTPTYDTNFLPARLYGFGSNSGPQAITVTFVTTT